LLHPDDYERLIDAWRHSQQTGERFAIECRIRNGKTGEYRWFLNQAQGLKDGNGVIEKWFGTGTDIDDQKRAEEEQQRLHLQLEAEQARLQEVFNQMPGGVIIAEAPSGKILMGNKQVEDIFGHPVLPSPSLHHYGEWIGFHLNSGEPVKSEEWPLARAIAYGEVVKEEDYEYLRGDGIRSIIRVNAAPIRDSQGTIVAGVVTVIDVTEQRALERRKDEFISIASHELKTPITTVKALTQLLKRKLEKQGLTEHTTSLSKIETNINKLTRLTNELLDVSKIQAGKLIYVSEPLAIQMLVQEAVETAQQTSTTHTLTVQGSTQRSVLGDSDRLMQVFMNLFSNAIKYSPLADRVEVFVEEREDDVHIHIRDYGLGIAKEHQEKIFDRFYRVENGNRTSIQGLGMGLYIAYEIVKRHGGDITVDSEEGVGTTFSVVLPLMIESVIEG
jgi:signal transduction histidine kinase